MALYLEGKTTVDTNELSPKEATQMSYDVKYIGMDVHKEAIVIAVLNGAGKMIMETILETKASSILQFIHGLGGELHVTWEEGTCMETGQLASLSNASTSSALCCRGHWNWRCGPVCVHRLCRA
jgi:hypothetical protein